MVFRPPFARLRCVDKLFLTQLTSRALNTYKALETAIA
ncbi:hypothetical protein SPAR67_1047 [Streptococcus pneumoniae GA41277]|nr:hypothetical protein SPAR85_1066 [Streptococcus pneumoniae GA44500]EHE20215.1 hypothetical protein SPAR67_1047 [Streptococcus pneumoniae GA41277]EJG44473.1 hypothetical protein AMCSP13_001270 [Streptococcus pneumoniae 2070335]EJH21793.1 hypothetical protein SPAR168_1018 [Streptococcus pneumoniae GA62681]KGI23888.1 hypothetical protein BM52_1418 [Streptococcus pneumoniae]